MARSASILIGVGAPAEAWAPGVAGPGRCACRYVGAGRGGLLLEMLLALTILAMAGMVMLGVMSDATSAAREARQREQVMDLARSALALIESGAAQPEGLNGPVAAWPASLADSLGSGRAIEGGGARLGESGGGVGAKPGGSGEGAGVSWSLRVEALPWVGEGAGVGGGRGGGGGSGPGSSGGGRGGSGGPAGGGLVLIEVTAERRVGGGGGGAGASTVATGRGGDRGTDGERGVMRATIRQLVRSRPRRGGPIAGGCLDRGAVARGRRARGRARGFTLIEVLLALGLLVVVASAVMSLWWTMASRRDELLSYSGRGTDVGVLIERMEAAFLGAVAGDRVIGAGIKGDSDRVRVISRAVALGVPGRADAGGEGVGMMPDLVGTEYIGVPGGGDGVDMKRWTVGKSGAEEDGESGRMASGVTRVRLRYFTGSAWAEQFDSLAAGGLPAAVEIALWTNRPRDPETVGGAGDENRRAPEVPGDQTEGRAKKDGGGSLLDQGTNSARLQSEEERWGPPARVRVIAIPDGGVAASGTAAVGAGERAGGGTGGGTGGEAGDRAGDRAGTSTGRSGQRRPRKPRGERRGRGREQEIPIARRGLALWAVLVVITAAALSATATLYVAAAERSASVSTQRRPQARALAWSGVQAVMEELSSQRGAVLAGATPRVTLEGLIYAAGADGAVVGTAGGGGAGTGERGRYRVVAIRGEAPVAEGGRLDVNFASAELLKRAGLSEASVAAVVAARGQRRAASLEELAFVSGVRPVAGPGGTGGTGGGAAREQDDANDGGGMRVGRGRVRSARDGGGTIGRAGASSGTGSSGEVEMGNGGAGEAGEPGEILTAWGFEPEARTGGLDGRGRGQARVSVARGWTREIEREVEATLGPDVTGKLRDMMPTAEDLKKAQEEAEREATDEPRGSGAGGREAGGGGETPARAAVKAPPRTRRELISRLRGAGVEASAWGGVLDTITVLDDGQEGDSGVGGESGGERSPIIVTGRIDGLRAPAAVLAALPGMDAGKANAWVEAREKLTEAERWDLAWPVTRGVVDADTFEGLADLLTQRTVLWRVRIEGGIVDGENGGGGKGPASEAGGRGAEEEVWRDRVTLEAVIDLSEERPRVAYLRDVTLERAGRWLASQSGAAAWADAAAAVAARGGGESASGDAARPDAAGVEGGGSPGSSEGASKGGRRTMEPVETQRAREARERAERRDREGGDGPGGTGESGGEGSRPGRPSVPPAGTGTTRSGRWTSGT